MLSSVVYRLDVVSYSLAFLLRIVINLNCDIWVKEQCCHRPAGRQAVEKPVKCILYSELQIMTNVDLV